MGQAWAEGDVGPETIKATGIALIVLTSLVVAVRFIGSVRRLNDLKTEDYLLMVAYIFFLELSILYIYIAPAISRLAALSDGEIPPYPTVSQDAVRLQIVFFVTTSSLWVSLWLVKFSLLSMYKRLLVGKQYLIAWWAITISCILLLIGCIISSWLSCESFHAWFTPGACDTARDHRAARISLYYAYAVDILTDLAIMALPLRLIWNLRMKLKQKLSIGGLFCFGWVCIIVSTIRVVKLGEGVGNGVPAPSWLALWATIEASIAVMIGCCPGLYRVIKSAVSPSKNSYQYNTYTMRARGSGNPSRRSGMRGAEIAMNSFTGKPDDIYQSASAYRSSSPASSQEKLAHPSDRGNIMVNYGVAVTVEDRENDFERTRRFI